MSRPTPLFVDDPPPAGGDVALLVPGAWCLAATVSTAGLPRRGRAAALLYRLEVLLPVAAEDVAADFVDQPGTGTALGVALPAETVRDKVAALEAAGVVVQRVVPASLLAVAGWLAGKDRPAVDAVCWGDGAGHVEVFRLRNRRVAEWYVVPADPTDVGLVLAQIGPAKVAAIDVPFAVSGEMVDVVHTEATPMRTAAAATGVPFPVDLRNGGLAAADTLRTVRRPLIHLGVAAAAALIAFGGVALWRADRLRAAADAAGRRQAAVYQHLFPGRPAPSGDVVARMQSEERRLKKAAAAADAGPNPAAVLANARDALAAVSEAGLDEAAVQVRDVQVAGDRLSISGRAAKRADADAVADALRKRPGLTVEPPQVEPGGERGAVPFTVTATAGGVP